MGQPVNAYDVPGTVNKSSSKISVSVKSTKHTQLKGIWKKVGPILYNQNMFSKGYVHPFEFPVENTRRYSSVYIK